MNLLNTLIELLLPVLLGIVTQPGFDLLKSLSKLNEGKLPAWLQQLLVPLLAFGLASAASLIPGVDLGVLQSTMAAAVAMAIKAGK